jgi:hypothetical protein
VPQAWRQTFVVMVLAGCGRPFIGGAPAAPFPEHCRRHVAPVARGALVWDHIEDRYVASFWAAEPDAWRRTTGALLDLAIDPAGDSLGVLRGSWDSLVAHRATGSGAAPVPDTLVIRRAAGSMWAAGPSRRDTIRLVPDSASRFAIWGRWSSGRADGSFCATRSSGWYHRVTDLPGSA